MEELRRDFEPDLARDLEAVFGARRLVDFLLVRALPHVFRLVDVFPDADVKFFLTARPEVRARRRHEELTAKGDPTFRNAARTEAGNVLGFDADNSQARAHTVGGVVHRG